MITVVIKNKKTRKNKTVFLEWANTMIAFNGTNSLIMADPHHKVDIKFSNKNYNEKIEKAIDKIVDTFLKKRLDEILFISNNENNTIDKIIYNNVIVNIK